MVLGPTLASSGAGDWFWDRFLFFSGTVDYSFRRNKVFGRVLSGFGWGSWWGPRGQQFRWNSVDLGGFWMGFGPVFAKSGARGIGIGVLGRI